MKTYQAKYVRTRGDYPMTEIISAQDVDAALEVAHKIGKQIGGRLYQIKSLV